MDAYVLVASSLVPWQSYCIASYRHFDINLLVLCIGACTVCDNGPWKYSIWSTIGQWHWSM